MDVWIVWLLLAAVLGVAELVHPERRAGAARRGRGRHRRCGGARRCRCRCSCWCSPRARRRRSGWCGPSCCATCTPRRPQRFGVDALVGRSAQVVREISSHGGTVRIDGEEWTARPCDPHDPAYVIPAGATVSVMAIRGATALVYPQE